MCNHCFILIYLCIIHIFIIIIGFCFVDCYASTQLAIHLHQEHIQVVHSNREARKLPAGS